jgi:glyoxylase-like metal-dependent hydrolase (beta-lactamase superfamily II)
LQFTLQGTNTYLLGHGQRRLLIDTGQGEKQWLETLSAVLRQQSPQPATVSTCILTHWHHDHVGGVKDLEKLCEDAADSDGGVKVFKNQPTLNPDGILDPDRVTDITDGQRFRTEATENEFFEIEAVHTPGHAKDHMCFIVTASPDPAEVGSMFTADNVLGHGTAVFEDLHTYLETLALMKNRVEESVTNTGVKKRRAFPGHGAVIEDAVAKIDEYIAHRRMREEEALNVLRYGTVKRPDETVRPVHDSLSPDDESDDDVSRGLGKEIASGKEWESLEMVRVIYTHYPESLYKPAEFGLLMVLEKLRRDGKVIKTPTGKWTVSEKAAL